VGAFRAVQWLSGEGPVPHADDEAYIVSITDDWHAATKNPLPLLRAHARAVLEEARARDRVRSLEASAAAAATPGEREAFTEAADARREVAAARYAEAERYSAQAAALGLLPCERDPLEREIRHGEIPMADYVKRPGGGGIGTPRATSTLSGRVAGLLLESTVRHPYPTDAARIAECKDRVREGIVYGESGACVASPAGRDHAELVRS
jgi:hypothetical protein